MAGDAASVPDAAGELSLSPRERGLISSAYRVATQQGSHRLPLQDIANDARVSKRSLLYHYPFKNNVCSPPCAGHSCATAERIRGSIAAAVTDPHPAAQALIDPVFIGAKQNRNFYLLYLELVEHAARDPQFKPRSMMTHEIANDESIEILDHAIERGRFTISDVDGTAVKTRVPTSTEHF